MNIKKIFGIISWMSFSIMVALVAIYLILISDGYKINYKSFSITKTGMISIKSSPSDVAIYIDDKLVSNKTPFRYGDLTPGKYSVKISSDGYDTWEKTLDVEEGKTTAEENVVLFLANPIKLSATDDEKNSLPDFVKDWPAKGLVVKNDYEIWFDDVYITRFSDKIRQFGWYSDLEHIIVQVGKEIIIMEPDGFNITKLVQLDSDQASQFVPVNDSKELLYLDGAEVKKIKITN